VSQEFKQQKMNRIKTYPAILNDPKGS